MKVSIIIIGVCAPIYLSTIDTDLADLHKDFLWTYTRSFTDYMVFTSLEGFCSDHGKIFKYLCSLSGCPLILLFWLQVHFGQPILASRRHKVSKTEYFKAVDDSGWIRSYAWIFLVVTGIPRLGNSKAPSCLQRRRQFKVIAPVKRSTGARGKIYSAVTPS